MQQTVPIKDTEPLLTPERRQSIKEILEQGPSEEQLSYEGRPSLKAARVLGEAKLATQSQKRGSKIEKHLKEGERSDEEARRLANEELARERVERLADARAGLEAQLGKPTEEQLQYPEVARNKPASIKALHILGDEVLEIKAKGQFDEENHPGLKALKVLGADLAPTKARKILGSSVGDGEARAMADRHWNDTLSRASGQHTKKVLATRPNDYVRALPSGCGPVAKKALELLGEDELKHKSLRALAFRAPAKVVKTLGESSLAGEKAQELTGDLSKEYIRGKRKLSVQSKSPLAITYRKFFRQPTATAS